MKRKNEWNRKAMKRRIKNASNGIVELLKIIHHFFDDFKSWIGEMKDPRCIPYCTYTQQDYIFMAILKNICGQKSMSSMDENFNEDICIKTLQIMSGDNELNEMPHKDSLNYYLERLEPNCLSDLREKMIKRLIRMKSFNRARVLNKYWRVILDGTGIHYYKEKPDEHCLVSTVTKEDGTKVKMYYRKVLEAKIILGDKLVFSLDTEFIENENENVSKQDCEVRAAERLLNRVKENYPRMDFCIQGDALYATEPFMAFCREKQWQYLFTIKDGRQPLLTETFRWIIQGDDENTVKNIGAELGTGKFCNHVEVTAGKNGVANMFEYAFEKPQNEETRNYHFQWITNIMIDKKNLEELVGAGRGRGKIENEGFNNQKNGIYDIEHLNSHNYNAIKNHYILTQISDIIMQLYLSWSPLLKQAKTTIKNTSAWLLESFRTHTITEADVSYIETYTTIYLE